MISTLFIAGFGIGILLTIFRNPVFGLYTYLFTFYMDPNDGWWSKGIPDARYLLIIGVIAVVATLFETDKSDRTKWYRTAPGRLLIAFVLYNWLQVFWAVKTDFQIEGAILYTKHLIAFYLMYHFSTSITRVQTIALAHVVGCAWFGYLALGASGGRLETIGGAVAGSNELGVHVSTGLIFGGILLLSLAGIRRWITFAALPLAANTLVLTVSRGAFLGFLAGGLSGLFIMPKSMRKGYIAMGMLGLILVAILANDDLIERFDSTYRAVTGQEEELDHSATSRLDIARAGIIIGLEHPFGAGNRATELLSGPYISDWDHGRAAHNTTLGVFAEYGIPGLALYFLTILWVLRTSWVMRRLDSDSEDPELAGYSAVAAMLGASLIAIYVSGNFSSNIDLETQYWCLALLAATNTMAQDHRKRVPGSSEVVAHSGQYQRSRTAVASTRKLSS